MKVDQVSDAGVHFDLQFAAACKEIGCKSGALPYIAVEETIGAQHWKLGDTGSIDEELLTSYQECRNYVSKKLKGLDMADEIMASTSMAPTKLLVDWGALPPFF